MNAPLADLGNRRAARTSVYYIARIATLADEHRVKLLDVSLFGARVQTDLELETGDEVQLIRAHLHILSRVAWTRHNHVGLEFVDPAADQEAILALSQPLGL